MTAKENIEGLEFDWLAVDADGFVALLRFLAVFLEN